jgi:MerR family transcriptional regulator, copper efflux regulator
MQIGTVAKTIGLSADAIRFYERSALLPPAPRTADGFRQYGKGDVETLLFIRRVQGLGFALDEIRDLLGMRRSKLRACLSVRRRLEKKLASVCVKLADLQRLQRELRSALRSCDRELQKRPARCPLLEVSKSREAESAV